MQKILSILYITLSAVLMNTADCYPTFAEYVVKFKKNYLEPEYSIREQKYKQRIASFEKIVSYIPGVNEFSDMTDQEYLKMIGFQNHKLQVLQQGIHQAHHEKLSQQQAYYRDLHVRNLMARNSTVRILQTNTTNCSNTTNSSNSSNCSNSSVRVGARGLTFAQICPTYCSTNTCRQRFDRRENSQISPPKNAGGCTSSTYAAVSLLQSNYFLAKGTMLDFSQNYVKKCIPVSYNCQNINLQTLLDQIRTQGNISLQSEYDGTKCGSLTKTYLDYNSVTEQCRLLVNIASKIFIAVAISNAVPQQSSYTSGVLSCTQTSRSPDYYAHVVGYTQDYWIVKMHLGTSWGYGGFAYINRDIKHDCGITWNTQYNVFQSTQENKHRILGILLVAVLFVFIN